MFSLLPPTRSLNGKHVFSAGYGKGLLQIFPGKGLIHRYFLAKNLEIGIGRFVFVPVPSSSFLSTNKDKQLAEITCKTDEDGSK
jgi:hypothetical protein